MSAEGEGGGRREGERGGAESYYRKSSFCDSHSTFSASSAYMYILRSYCLHGGVLNGL